MEENRSLATLHQLLDYEVRQSIAAELQLRQSLEQWINHASSLPFKAVLQKYLGFVEQHLQKLESYRDEEKAGTFSIGNRVMRALVEESEERMRHCPDTEIKDVCLLACIQVINHFKISAFGTAAAFANELKMEKAAAIFHEMEINEKHIDDRLSQLAEHELNKKARTPILITG